MVAWRIFQVLSLHVFIASCFGENVSEAKRHLGMAEERRWRWRNTSLNKRYESSFFSPEGFENCSDSFFLFWGDRQGAKRVKWLSEKSLSILENFFDSFRLRFSFFALWCFKVFMLCFFWGNNEEFLLKIITSPLQGTQMCILCALFFSFSLLARLAIVEGTTWKQTDRNSFFNFSTFCFIARHLALAVELDTVQDRRKTLDETKVNYTRESEWKSKELNLFIHLRTKFHRKVSTMRDCSYHYTSCWNVYVEITGSFFSQSWKKERREKQCNPTIEHAKSLGVKALYSTSPKNSD